MRGLSTNFYIHISVIDLYILTNDHLLSYKQNRQTDCGIVYISLTDI
jgi:hypothetical protein